MPTDIYFAVSPDASDQSAGGNITVNADGTYVMTVSQAGAYWGVGWVVLANSISYIVQSITSATTGTCRKPTGALPDAAGPVAITSIKPVWTSTNAGAAGAKGASFLNTTNIATADFNVYILQYIAENGTTDTTAIAIATLTTSTTCRLNIRPAEASEHHGTVDHREYVVAAASYRAVDVNASNVWFTHPNITLTAYTDANVKNGFYVRASQTGIKIFKGKIYNIKNVTSATSSIGMSVAAGASVEIYDTFLEVENTVSGRPAIGLQLNGTGTLKIVNSGLRIVTVDNTARGVYCTAAGDSATVKNCYGIDFAGATKAFTVYGAGHTMVVNNCVYQTGVTLSKTSGANNVETSQTTAELVTSFPGWSYSVPAGSDLIGAGLGTSDGDVQATDFFDVARGAASSTVGPAEYVAPAASIGRQLVRPAVRAAVRPAVQVAA